MYPFECKPDNPKYSSRHDSETIYCDENNPVNNKWKNWGF